MLGDIQQSILDTIAQGEAPDYRTIYGGHKFSSLKDHPRIKIPLPNGKITTAAGRYQMLAPTWDMEKKKLGLKDFSPESQDQAAWDLAEHTYEQKTGRDLESDAQAQQVDWGALAHQWPSLLRLAKQDQPDQTMPPGLDGQVSPAPSISNQDMNIINAPPNPLMVRQPMILGNHTLQPVEFDPFKLNPPEMPQ